MKLLNIKIGGGYVEVYYLNLNGLDIAGGLRIRSYGVTRLASAARFIARCR